MNYVLFYDIKFTKRKNFYRKKLFSKLIKENELKKVYHRLKGRIRFHS